MPSSPLHRESLPRPQQGAQVTCQSSAQDSLGIPPLDVRGAFQGRSEPTPGGSVTARVPEQLGLGQAASGSEVMQKEGEAASAGSGCSRPGFSASAVDHFLPRAEARSWLWANTRENGKEEGEAEEVAGAVWDSQSYVCGLGPEAPVPADTIHLQQ